MKFIRKEHNDGDTRIKRWFALFPVSIYNQGKTETRWLEMVTTKQQYVITNDLYSCYCSWGNIEFIDEHKTLRAAK